MNAKEARALSEQSAAEKAKRLAEEQAERARIAAQKEAEHKTEYLKDLKNRIHHRIQRVIKEGKTSTEISLCMGSVRHHREAQEKYDTHEYLEEIKKILDEFEKDGYTVTQDIQCDEHSTNHESSVPDYNWYEYYPIIRVSW